MTQAERDRLVALKKAKKKLITQRQAAEEIGVTERQVRRLLRRLRIRRYAGRLTAGPPEHVERCRPLMEAVGRGITIVGQDAWQANLVKLASNFIIVALIETLGEAFALMRKAGISVHAFLEMANPLFGSPLFGISGQLIADEKYQPAGFRLRLGLKDVNLALAAAGELAVPMPLAGVIRDHFLEGLAHGYGDSLRNGSIWRGMPSFSHLPEEQRWEIVTYEVSK